MILEQLEKRLAPAGVVSIVLNGGALKITGDVEANQISISEISANIFRVTGTSGTSLHFGSGSGSTFDIANVTKGLTMDLKEGNDVLTLGEMSVGGAVGIALGAGNNTLTISDDLHVAGDFTVTGLKGDDTINATGTGHDVGVTGKCSINLGDGANTIALQDMNEMVFGNAFSYAGGTGQDSVSIAAVLLSAAGPVDLKVGAGGATVALDATTLNLKGAVSFTSLAHTTQSSFALSGDIIHIGTNLTIAQGNGTSTNSIGANTELAIGGNVSITNGHAAAGQGNTSGVASNHTLVIGGNATFANGTGNHTNVLGATDAVKIGGKVSFSNDNGSTGNSVSGSEVEIGDSLTITNKKGSYKNQVTADALHVNHAITITNGDFVTNGAGPAAGNTISGKLMMHAGAINITNGVGYYTNMISMINQGSVGSPVYDTGTVTAGITIKNGNSPAPPVVTVSDSGPEAIGTGTSTTLQGAFQIGGNLAITNGNGSFQTKLGTDVNTQHLYVGGNLTITNGNANTAGLSNLVTLDTLTVGKGMTITSGNSSGGGNNIFTVHETNVLGAFSLTNGNCTAGNLSNTLALTHSSFGSLTIKNGNGIGIANLIGGTVPGGNSLAVAGALSMTNGNATDILFNGIQVNVNNIGSVAFKNGNGGSNVNLWSFDSLRVTGALSMTNGNVHSLPGVTTVVPGTMGNVLGFEHGELSLGSLTFKNGDNHGTGQTYNSIACNDVHIVGAASISSGLTTGSTSHTIVAERMVIGGAMTIATKSGDTVNTISADVVELASLTFNHGSGDDQITLGKSDSAIFVTGNITANLGAGDTQTIIGDSAKSLTITGNVGITSLDGTDSLTVTANGRIGGNVACSFGKGTVAGLTLSGYDLTKDGFLHVAGTLSLTASVDTSIAVTLNDGSFGALSLTGGTQQEQIHLKAATMRGAVKLDLKGANDSVEIDDTTFLSTLTILGGAGADSVLIESDPSSSLPGQSRFFGAVNVDMGADNDTVDFQAAAAPNGILFYSSVILAGGTGVNTFNSGANVIYLGTPAQPAVTGFGP